ncbi:MAG: DRTGG domain-containing protein [Spirochaetaceae bacterium]
MATVASCVEALSAQLIVAGEGYPDRLIEDVVVSDLMSDVLVVDTEEFILITSLASDQVIRTADIVGAAAVVLTNGKQPQTSMVELAKQQGITLLSSPKRSVEAVLAVAEVLGRVRRR